MSTERKRPSPRPQLERGRLRAAIEDAFTELALHPARQFHFISGPPVARRLGYTPNMLRNIPPAAIASFAGVGNPFRMGWPAEGEVVLDVGCGAGTDVLIAAHHVGASGLVIGVDMTPAMVERAQLCVAAAGADNVRIEWGHAESLPVPDHTVDLVISNGVFSLTPDKGEAFAEVRRVLKPGGRLRVADTFVRHPLPSEVVGDARLWTDCIAGAVTPEEYRAALAKAGFVDIESLGVFDVFAGTRIEERAGQFRVRAQNVRARAADGRRPSQH